jgi:hypothetical protein
MTLMAIGLRECALTLNRAALQYPPGSEIYDARPTGAWPIGSPIAVANRLHRESRSRTGQSVVEGDAMDSSRSLARILVEPAKTRQNPPRSSEPRIESFLGAAKTRQIPPQP